ncbi:hypothetical protein PV379_21605 [Streptomyces caniscabiei]|uniref:hypothetical protein n=1 Tax=Streptomyces caniscabiei TaxID=2746961 RepID=UPI0029BE3DFE|nr:hypothetical protein [Streptomyces caniscabiei]MDX2599460.1 hypothetical protein [Streptomyces caniscabiei]MDX2735245.1 hypothetical protein [Streptomyces caniscabiei]MDX2779892.1 hypothetical protein [Streptomyces caniscabiei]
MPENPTLTATAEAIPVSAQPDRTHVPAETGRPVPGGPAIRFQWHTGDWFDVFEKHVALIQSDIARAQAEDRVVVYLSCPISSRGGGHFRTNTEIANFVARRLASEWGERFFVVNPAAYQLESKEGTGLVERHIEELARETGRPLKLRDLMDAVHPSGGDYMRMWTRVLAEDHYLTDPGPHGRHGRPGEPGRPSRRKLHLGGLFDAFYFLGPDDVHGFFRADAGGGGALVAAVEAYFARKYAIDPDFWTDFGTVSGPDGDRRPLDLTDPDDAKVWEARRKEFVRFYTVRAGGSYSLGCHDEWNIFVRLNRARAGHPAYGPGELIAAYYGGRARSMAESELETSPGYEVKEKTA